MTDTLDAASTAGAEKTVSQPDSIETFFVCQGCQAGVDVAKRLAAYIAQARETLDMTAYSFSLCPDTRDIVVAAFRERSEAGVKIRIAYDAGTQVDLITDHNDPCDFTTPSSYNRWACLPKR